MAPSPLLVTEVLRVDHFEARRLDRETQKLAACPDDSISCIRADVAVGLQPPSVRTEGLDAGDARDRLELGFEVSAFCFDIEIEVTAENLTAQLIDAAEQHDVAVAEQRDPVANALHTLEQMRRQQYRDV